MMPSKEEITEATTKEVARAQKDLAVYEMTLELMASVYQKGFSISDVAQVLRNVLLEEEVEDLKKIL